MAGVPYTFGSATTSIPLSQLDSNFTTPVTIGSTTVALGNTVASLAGLTSVTTTGDSSISGLTVGKGGGAVSTNTALGNGALGSNTTATNNTAVGFQAGYFLTTGGASTGANAFFGYYAGRVSTGDLNCYLGYASGQAATSGSNNTFVGGYNSGGTVTTGAKNTILGNYNGNQGSLDIRTSSNYIVLSDGDGNPRCYWNSNGQINNFANQPSDVAAQFYNTNATSPFGMYLQLTAASPNNTAQYMFRAQDSTTTCYTIYTNGTTAGRSDARLKKNIVDASPKLEDICKLQVRNYEWKESEGGSKEIGLIAQEVETVFPNLVITHDVEKDGDDYKEVKYSVFVPMLLKAVQELKTIVDAQAAEIAELKAKVGI